MGSRTVDTSKRGLQANHQVMRRVDESDRQDEEAPVPQNGFDCSFDGVEQVLRNLPERRRNLEGKRLADGQLLVCVRVVLQ